MKLQRGDIYIVELNGEGSEQRGSRPCLIIQNDMGNTYSNTTIILPITSQNKRYTKTHVDIECLRYPSTVLCEQIRVLDKSKLQRKIATLSAEKMMEVQSKILITLGMEL